MTVPQIVKEILEALSIISNADQSESRAWIRSLNKPGPLIFAGGAESRAQPQPAQKLRRKDKTSRLHDDNGDAVLEASPAKNPADLEDLQSAGHEERLVCLFCESQENDSTSWNPTATSSASTVCMSRQRQNRDLQLRQRRESVSDDFLPGHTLAPAGRDLRNSSARGRTDHRHRS